MLRTFETDISAFRFDIIRRDICQRLDPNMPEADAFQQLSYDLIKSDSKDDLENLILFRTRGRMEL